ncbi:Fur family transcriptional regulator [Rhodoflexus sp.]
MHTEHIRKILDQKGVRKTKIREAVLALFLDKGYALSHADIELHLPRGFDRVTIYRTLKSFEEQGLIHKVPDERGLMRYALCPENHNQEHSHLHFFCRNCEHTYCIHVPVPYLTLPTGFQAESYEWLVQGICRNCEKSYINQSSTK